LCVYWQINILFNGFTLSQFGKIEQVREADTAVLRSRLTVAGTGNDVIAIARCATDDVEVDGSLTGCQPHLTFAVVGSAVTGADRLAGLGRTVLRTDAAAVLAAGTVPTRDRRTRIYANQRHQPASQSVTIMTDDDDDKFPAASLRWVTPRAATEGVIPLFFPAVSPLFILKTDDLFCSPLSLFIDFYSGATPSPIECHPAHFLPVRLRFSAILCKFAHNFFSFECHPPKGCHPGRSAPPLVTPLQISTGKCGNCWFQ